MSLFHVYDKWRGETRPGALEGEDIPVGARLARLAGIAVLSSPSAGAVSRCRQCDAAQAACSTRAWWLASRTTRQSCWPGLSETGARSVVLEMEPHPYVTVPDLRLAGEVFGDLADLKSPYSLGHSRAVAALAAGAAEELRLPEGTRADLEVAGLLHDVGRVAVSSAVWERRGPLAQHGPVGTGEAAPYRSQRYWLVPPAELARLAPLVGRHHERLDGSGRYYRGCSQEDLTMPGRVLAAAAHYRALTERRR